jgi:hypothetical protein
MRVDGALVWSIKTSFRDYVAAMPDGRHTVEAPATQDAVGFMWPAVPRPGGPLRFTGAVTFHGHRGALHVEFRDLRLELGGQRGVLTLSDPDWPGRRMALATFLTKSTGPHEWAGTDVRLTADGSDLFFQVYDENERLDDFAVRDVALH